MAISKEILQSQAEYAARPYEVYINSSHFGGSFRFHTLAEAIEYLETQYARYRKEISQTRYRSFNAKESVLTLPGGVEVQCREFIGDSLSSYY